MPPILTPMLTPKSTKSHTQNFLPPPSKPSYEYNLQYSFEQQFSHLQAKSDETIIQTRGEDDEIEMMNARIKICEIYILQSDWKAALRNLREILRIDSNNSKCLALLGVVYKNINQPQMAKASFKRSLYINPQEALALKHLMEFNESDSTTTDENSKSDRKSIPSTIKKPPIQQKRSWLDHLLEWLSSRRS